jgi:hypothetical protein
MKINKMKINKIIIAIAFLPLISIAQEAKSQNISLLSAPFWLGFFGIL